MPETDGFRADGLQHSAYLDLYARGGTGLNSGLHLDQRHRTAGKAE